MFIIEFDGPPSWSLDASETGESTLSSLARIKRPRWRPVELNDKHVRSHGKIGDCEQSTRVISRITKYHLASLIWFRGVPGL